MFNLIKKYFIGAMLIFIGDSFASETILKSNESLMKEALSCQNPSISLKTLMYYNPTVNLNRASHLDMVGFKKKLNKEESEKLIYYLKGIKVNEEYYSDNIIKEISNTKYPRGTDRIRISCVKNKTYEIYFHSDPVFLSGSFLSIIDIDNHEYYKYYIYDMVDINLFLIDILGSEEELHMYYAKETGKFFSLGKN